MRMLAALLLLTGTAAAAAQTPPATATGARPGNVIGTGMSLPRSDTAGNIDPADTKSVLAPNLPVPEGAETPHALLLDARTDLAAKRTGAAQEALERAETRLLDRSIPAGTERVPADSARINAITEALSALSVHNTAGAIALVDKALQIP